MTITIKFSPLLLDEMQYAVSCWMDDMAAKNTPADLSAADKIMNHGKGPIELTLAEAKVIYNEMWNLEDKVRIWADEEAEVTINGSVRPAVKWLSVHRAISTRLAQLRTAGVAVDERGWAR